MQKWILPTLSEILAWSESSLASCPSEQVGWTAATQNDRCAINLPVYSMTHEKMLKRVRAEREWRAAIAAMEQLLLQSIELEKLSVTDSSLPEQGLLLAGPVPVLSHKVLLSSLQTGIFTAEWLKLEASRPFQLPPATATSLAENAAIASELELNASSVVPLIPGDPLVAEQFCLVLTAKFSLVLVLGEDTSGVPAFMFSFEPVVVQQAWRSLRARVMLTSAHFLASQLDNLVEQYYPVAPDYRTVTQFSRLLLKHLPDVEEARGEGREARGERRETEEYSSHLTHQPSSRPDVELLQAFAHEVRTPLTTIRTLIRLLLKRRDLATDVLKRLETIDSECMEQIDRMELLFRAAELETSKVNNSSAYLTAMSLEQVLQQSIPRWQQRARRRNLTLEVVLPQQLPTVVSDPRMLDQVLTGLIESFTRSLPAGSHIEVQVIPAGHQLKLQLLSQFQSEDSSKAADSFPVPPIRKSLGQLLTFQPETGNISLNLTATKHLFQAIGGKLIVRQRPDQGEVLTIFLPLEVKHTDFPSQRKGIVNQPVG
nr:HAMP domain-containing sensor histidine kinase [Chroococcidiopsis sp. CCMEE 29]